MFLVNLVTLFKKWRKTNPVRLQAWIEDGLFQLHKANLELDGSGPWKGLENAVPVTDQSVRISKNPSDKAGQVSSTDSAVDTTLPHQSARDEEVMIETTSIRRQSTASLQLTVSSTSLETRPSITVGDTETT